MEDEELSDGGADGHEHHVARELGRSGERGSTPILELAAPFERVLAWPLANGALLEASVEGGWRSVTHMGALFPHTLFVTGRNASASLIEFHEGAGKDTRHLVVANAHL